MSTPERTVPVEAIMAEVLTVRLFRRWLVSQGARLFSNREPLNCLGAYFLHAAGCGLFVHRSEAPSWLWEIDGWSDRHCTGYTAAEAVVALDAIVAAIEARGGTP